MAATGPGTGGNASAGGAATSGSGTTAGAGGNAASSGASSSGGASTGAGGASSAGGGVSAGGAGGSGGAATGFPENPAVVVLSSDGGWCWFESPRVLFHESWLVIGSVASGVEDAARAGDIEAIVHDLGSGETTIVELHDRLELDDHDSPAFALRPDGRLVAAYAKHGPEAHFYYRISTGTSPLAWEPEQTFAPTTATRLTYSNLYLLSAEQNRIYDFYRGLDDSYKPSYAFSDDFGATWQSGNIVINVPSEQRHRPYVNYASNGVDTVHLVYTEAHPRDFDNSLYHVYYRAGSLYRSDGQLIDTLARGLASPDQGTRLFQGNSENVAWIANVVLDTEGHPVAAYSVQVGSQGLPTGQGGDDIRYRYARWDGTAWQDHELAFAGSRLYAGEDDYSGLVALDPEDPSVLFLSTNADPVSGDPLVSASDGQRHYEIFRGVTSDGGATFAFTAVTSDSSQDNLRPILPPRGPGGQRALLWLRGTYRAYTNYAQEVVAVLYRE
ncbi:MAG TPA: BNR-4 repeat-containing protein [Polyangiaceae bacterium]